MAKTKMENCPRPLIYLGLRLSHGSTCMANRTRWLIAMMLLTTGAASSFAQGTKADYDRANNLYWSTFGSVYHTRVVPHWTADGNAFWYVSIGPGYVRRYWWVDAVARTRLPAFDHERLAAALFAAQRIRTDADHLRIEDLQHDAKGKLTLILDGLKLTVDPDNYAVTADKQAAAPTHVLRRLDEVANSDPSHDGDDQAIISRIVNHTGQSLDIDLVNPDGTREPVWKGLRETTQGDITTYAGAVYVATGPKSEFVGAYRVEGDGGTIVIAPPGDPTTKPATQPTTAETPLEAGESPDHKWIAFVRNHNVWIRDKEAGKEQTLSTDGREGDGYQNPEGMYWSPNSGSLVAVRTILGEHAKLNYVRSSPPDQLQPRLESLEYARAGAKIDQDSLHLFNLTSHREVPITGVEIANAETLSGAEWKSDSDFVFWYVQRGHQLARVVAVDSTTGHAKILVDERSKTFINGTNSYATDGKAHDLFWTSECDGWNHLYHYDLGTGRVINQVTKGNWTVEPWDDDRDGMDTDQPAIYFRAGGVDPKQDPYYVHRCYVNIDGTGLVDLTPGDGTHEVQESPGGPFYIDTYSRVDMPPVTELRHDHDGKLICQLEKGDATLLLATGWRYPERFVAKGRDGATDIYGVIYRPTNFDPKKRYPVVEDIYSGPQQASVPKEFTRFIYPMEVAELGFIVVQIDGMGTPGRSKAFHDVCWHNLRDCGFADRIAWIKAAEAKHPEMDLSRVGIYGTSAGGYAAVRALEDHGDFYKVAVAVDGCHDLRLERCEWAEQWMGWPVGPGYAEQGNTDPAAVARINGKLLLMVSEMDNNVDPSSTLQLCNALIKADKDYDFLEIPNEDHGGNGYTNRRGVDFLVRNLLGVEPRSR